MSRRIALIVLVAFGMEMPANAALAEPVGLLPEITAEHGEIVVGGLYECHFEYVANTSKTICDPTSVPPAPVILITPVPGRRPRDLPDSKGRNLFPMSCKGGVRGTPLANKMGGGELKTGVSGAHVKVMPESGEGPPVRSRLQARER